MTSGTLPEPQVRAMFDRIARVYDVMNRVMTVGVDFSEAMLELARKKAPELHFEAANALELPFSDGEFDAATVGFGARNFSDLDRGLEEMARVVRPGGRVVILEIT